MSDGDKIAASSQVSPNEQSNAVVADKENRGQTQWIVATYWLVILLGLPFWWWTTTTERLALPSAQVQAWETKQPCPIFFDLPVTIDKTHAEEWSDLRKEVRSQCLDLTISDTGIDTPKSFQNTALYPKANPSIVKYAPKYKLVFSVFYEDASKETSLPNLSLADGITQNIVPLLASLRIIHEFDVEVQTQYFSPLALDLPTDGNGTTLDIEHLKAFVNTAQWNLASAVSKDPVLHFITYIPEPNKRPMLVKGQRRLNLNSFVLPQWGGVVLVNPASSEDISGSVVSALPVFSVQLARLLGLSDIQDEARSSDTDYRRRLQVNTLVRKRALECAREAVDTLTATVKLTSEIKNMRVNKDVRRGVFQALRQLDSASEATNDSSKLKHACEASNEASTAFFHPSMLGLLYFPQEHKYAVYTPLFGPVGIPLIAYLLWEIRRRRSERKQLVLDKQTKTQ